METILRLIFMAALFGSCWHHGISTLPRLRAERKKVNGYAPMKKSLFILANTYFVIGAVAFLYHGLILLGWIGQWFLFISGLHTAMVVVGARMWYLMEKFEPPREKNLAQE